MKKLALALAMALCITPTLAAKPDIKVKINPRLSVVLQDKPCTTKPATEHAETAAYVLGAPLANKQGTYVLDGKRGTLCWVMLEEGSAFVVDENGSMGAVELGVKI